MRGLPLRALFRRVLPPREPSDAGVRLVVRNWRDHVVPGTARIRPAGASTSEGEPLPMPLANTGEQFFDCTARDHAGNVVIVHVGSRKQVLETAKWLNADAGRSP